MTRYLMALIASLMVLVPCIVTAAAWGDDPKQGDPVADRGDRYQAKPAGTVENLHFYFGPYTVGPGQDANRIDVDLPVRNGYILSVEPSVRDIDSLEEYVHQHVHIHHAHWFKTDLFNAEDNYFSQAGFGTQEWVFGNGDEETRADFQPRTNADPNGPVYGQYVPGTGAGPVIYMIHNKNSEPVTVYIMLEITFMHGTPEELNLPGQRPVHDIRGLLFGRTFDVPREPDGDGTWDTTTGHRDKKPIEWTSQVDGTMIGTGGHLHPGGKYVIVENRGSEERPCRGDGPGGGVVIFRSDAVWRRALYSEEFQMTVSDPHWRAPIRKGDRIRLTGYYENKDNAWYTAMTHEGFYIDDKQPPRDGCAAYGVNVPQPKADAAPRAKNQRATPRKRLSPRQRMLRDRSKLRARQRAVLKRERAASLAFNPLKGVLSREWGVAEEICGEQYGEKPCDRPEVDKGEGYEVSTVTIADFRYLPGDMSLGGQMGAPARVKKGDSLTFINADQPALIRHTVTTCRWPCNGPYVSNYPWADGVYESGTLGYDPIDGGSPEPQASTPKDLAVGKYSYFCRIHPWMRGAFEVVE